MADRLLHRIILSLSSLRNCHGKFPCQPRLHRRLQLALATGALADDGSDILSRAASSGGTFTKIRIE